MAGRDGEKYISIAEAADAYGVTKTYFYEQIKAGKLDGFAIPGIRGTFMLRQEVERFMQPKPKTFGGQTA